MTRQDAVTRMRHLMDQYGLSDWNIRLTTSMVAPLGLCSYKDKCFILNAIHIDTHPDVEIEDTFLHEIAHALVGVNHGHDEVWKDKARELGATPQACSTMSLDAHAIDAIRSGAKLEVTFEEHVTRTAKYQVTQLRDKCPTCGKIAVTRKESIITHGEDKPDVKFIHLECGHLIIKKIPKGTPFFSLVSRHFPQCPKNEHVWVKNTCTKCKNNKPFQFQLEGMQFAESALAGNKGVLIADEMGLGKTIQALGYIKFHPEATPTLYVVKSAITYQWVMAILTWMGDEYVPQVIKTSTDVLIPGLKSYIISYDMMVFKLRINKKTKKEIRQGFDIGKFDAIGIKTIVLDECQQIKNPDSSRTQQVRRLAKDRTVIALSGTPWKNRGSEFFSVLNMIAPLKFGSYQRFIENWVQIYYDGPKAKQGGIKNPVKFKEYTQEILIRRERTEVMKELPLINRMKLYIQLDDFSQKEYDDATSDFVKWYNEAVIGGEEDNLNSMHVLAKLSRMRHITGLAKIPATEEFVEEFIESTDRKLVIFAHHKDVQQILHDDLHTKYNAEIPVLKLTGDQSSQERFEIQNKFNLAPRAILIASTLAAGEGLNLQTGADCVMHERQWNPANEEQAEGRFIRIGQTAKSVNATYVTGEGTIDDMFDGIVEGKRGSFHISMNNGEAPVWNEGDMIKALTAAIIDRWRTKHKNTPVREGVKSITELTRM